MSELLYDWLNKEVKMIPKIEFVTGFKLWELLCKLNLITDFHFSENYLNLKDYLFFNKKKFFIFYKRYKRTFRNLYNTFKDKTIYKRKYNNFKFHLLIVYVGLKEVLMLIMHVLKLLIEYLNVLIKK